MSAADSLRKLQREWDARVREAFPEAGDRAQFWQKVLHGQPEEHVRTRHRSSIRPRKLRRT